MAADPPDPDRVVRRQAARSAGLHRRAGARRGRKDVAVSVLAHRLRTAAAGSSARMVARPGLLLGVLVGTAAAARSLVAWLQPTPVFFPDEVIYSGLARGLAETGRPLLLGHTIDFPAVFTSY